LCFWLLGLWH